MTSNEPAAPGRRRGFTEFLTRQFLIKAAITIVGVGGAVTTGYFIWAGMEELDAATRAPTAPEEMLGQIETVLGANGGILHLEFEVTGNSDGIRYTTNAEGWFDFPEDRALLDRTSTWANSPVPVRSTELFKGEAFYRIPEGSESPTKETAATSRPACLPTKHYLAAILACGGIGLIGGEGPPAMSVLSDATWNGTPAYALVYEWTFQVEATDDRGTPPTPTPGAGTPTVVAPGQRATARYVFYVERTTRLPLALESTFIRDGKDVLGRAVIEFRSERLERTDIDSSMFDPATQGYRSTQEIEAELLDQPRFAGTLYWLGREVNGNSRVPSLRLEDASEADRWYAPERPVLLRLAYRPENGGEPVSVELWEAAGWNRFVGGLGAGFLDSAACAGATPETVGGRQFTILAGYKVDQGPSRSSTPPAAGSCPPHDRFMLLFEQGGYVTTINAPVFLYSNGPDWANDVATLVALGTELRQRRPGE